MDTWEVASEIAEYMIRNGINEVDREQLTRDVADIINTHRENY